jgi:CBS domain-containing protein
MQNRHDQGIMSISTTDVISAPQTMNIYGAFETLARWKFRRLPIVDPGTRRIKGIITAQDFVDFLGGGKHFNLIHVKHSGNFLSAINEHVSKIMSANVCTLHESAEIKDAIQIIVGKKIGGIPIVDHNMALRGIVTERDVLRALSNQKLISNKRVSEIMTRNLLVESADCSLKNAAKVMVENRFRRIPIVSENIFLGIVTATDFIRYIGTGQVFSKLITGKDNEVMNVPIRELMSTDLLLTNPDTSIGELAQIMVERGIGAVPVIENERLVGLVTEYDMVAALSRDHQYT